MSSSPAMGSKRRGEGDYYALATLRALRTALMAKFYVGVLGTGWKYHDNIHDDIPIGSPILPYTYRRNYSEWAAEIGKVCELEVGGENTPEKTAIRKANAERIARVDQAMRRLEAAAPMLGAIEEAKR